MLTSDQLLARLDDIIERSYLDFTYRIIGDDFFTDDQKAKVLALGIIPGRRPLIEILYDMVRQRNTQGYRQDATFQELLTDIARSGVLPDLSEEAAYTVKHAKAEMYEALEATKAKVKNKLRTQIMEANQQTKEELSTQAPIAPLPRAEIKEKNKNKLLKGLTVAAVAGAALYVFRRDFTTALTNMINSSVVDTTRQLASRQGKNASDALVYKQIVDDNRTSPECRALHTTNGSGDSPRIYRLSELIANGTNVGKPRSQWRAVIGGTHPNCRCTLRHVSDEMMDKLKNKN